MALLEIREVTRRFGDLDAVDRVSLAIEAGEFFTLLGPSGCGKTTLLRMIAGFDEPDAGEILLDGKPLGRHPAGEAPRAHGVPELRAVPAHDGGAATSPSRWRWRAVRATRSGRRVRETLALVHLEDKGGRYPARAVRRPEAARGAGPRPREQAAPAAARRAARRARRQAARGDAGRADQPAARRRHHLRLRHPRAAGGAGAVAPHRRDERRPRRAARRARTGSTPRRPTASSPTSSARSTCIEVEVVDARTGTC